MTWKITPTNLLPDDPDAIAYIAAVEAADGQALEPATKLAFNTFVKGCKADGTWPALKACCLMVGARTLAGALVPLVGPAPTNFNFVAGDYDRKTGLKGNGTSKYLNINYMASNLGINNHHISIYKTSLDTTGNTVVYMGATNNTTSATLSIIKLSGIDFSFSSSFTSDSVGTDSLNFIGITRNNSLDYQIRVNNAIQIRARASMVQALSTFHIFALPNNSTFRTNARLSYYSIGESLNLALLDARVSALMAALAVAIP